MIPTLREATLCTLSPAEQELIAGFRRMTPRAQKCLRVLAALHIAGLYDLEEYFRRPRGWRKARAKRGRR